MFSHPFSFTGRIRRLEYGISSCISAILFYCGLKIIEANPHAEGPGQWILFILQIPLYWFWIAQGAKRCHDRGNSGWFQLIPIYGLWLIFADSDPGQNEYGLNPKGIGNNIREKPKFIKEINKIDMNDLEPEKKSDLEYLLKKITVGKDEILTYCNTTNKFEIISSSIWNDMVNCNEHEDYLVVLNHKKN
ncbi:MAG: DUF805 domain-containing protein [Mariniphaga sp.]